MADKTTYYDPNGNIQIGYVVDGKTYTDEAGTQRVAIGSTVPTADGFYTLTENGGVKNPGFKEPVGGGGNTEQASLPAAGSGLMLNGKPVDWRTLNPHSLADYNGVLATPEEYAAALESARETAGVPALGGGYSPAQLPSASSAEAYLREWQDAAITAAQQGLKAAYDENMNTLNAAGEKIPAQYEAARNQTAAQSEVQRGNFNQYAAASGLNSGAGGQAQLAIGNQLQGDLSGLSKAEANAKADLELQRTQLTTQYKNDIAQAIADGNQAKALALYNDFVRVNDSLVSTAQRQADENYRAQTANQAMTDKQRTEQLALADNLAQYGIFTGYKGIYDDATIAAMEAAYKQKNQPKGGGGGGDPELSRFFIATGSNRYQNPGTNFTAKEYGDFIVNVGMNRSKTGMQSTIEDAYKEGKITRAQAEELMGRYGIEF